MSQGRNPGPFTIKNKYLKWEIIDHVGRRCIRLLQFGFFEITDVRFLFLCFALFL